ncbi:MAG: hypothetical protein ACLQM8_10620 [Limisphaerales bacterium]
MTTEIAVSKTLSIRDCGYDEHWLQDQIAKDPSILGLGDLEVVRREKQQSSGGKLDILLKDPENDTMYEVEVMLGATDESHIIRTIEYWDIEKRRWPQRQHFAVLVAEDVTRRFFNVVQLLSLSIPIIAIQANVIEANGTRILHFAKVLDAYEEPEDEPRDGGEVRDESWWCKHAASTLDTAKALRTVVSPVYNDRIELIYTLGYISLRAENNHFTLRGGQGMSRVSFCVNPCDADAVSDALKRKGLSPDRELCKDGSVLMRARVDRALVEENPDLFQLVAEFVKKCWS